MFNLINMRNPKSTKIDRSNGRLVSYGRQVIRVSLIFSVFDVMITLYGLNNVKKPS